MRVVAAAVTVLLLASSLPQVADAKLRLRKPRRGFQVRSTPFQVPPHGEREMCQAIRLGNDKPIDVDRIKVRMSIGDTYVSHHMAIFLPADSEAPLPPDIVDAVGCVGIGGAIVSPILGFVQRAEGDVIRFPKRVGVTFEPGQILLLNPHFINIGDEPVTGEVVVNFRKARRRRIRQHARSFQLGVIDISVPPGTTGSADGRWSAPFPMNVTWLSTHSHKHTVAVDVDVERHDGTIERLLTTTDYADPTVVDYRRPFLRLEPGDALHWTCRYRNDRPDTLRFGITSEDEMCFTVGFFLPDVDDAPLPPTPGCFGSGGGLVCPAN